MKRVTIFLIAILFVSLSACASANPQPVVDYVPLAPTPTGASQEKVVEMSTLTAVPPAAPPATEEAPLPAASAVPSLPTATAKGSLPAATGEAPQTPAPVPPLKTGGWQRVGRGITIGGGLPFTFELPNGWTSPNGAPYWVPAGEPVETTRLSFGINIFFSDLFNAPDPQLLPANSAVQSRTALRINNLDCWKYAVKVFNGEGGSASAYETHVIIRMENLSKAYVLYDSAPTDEGRAALNDIFNHALDSLSFTQ